MQILVLRCEHCHHDNVLTVRKAGDVPARYPANPDTEEKHAQGKQLLRDAAETRLADRDNKQTAPNVKRRRDD